MRHGAKTGVGGHRRIASENTEVRYTQAGKPALNASLPICPHKVSSEAMCRFQAPAERVQESQGQPR